MASAEVLTIVQWLVIVVVWSVMGLFMFVVIAVRARSHRTNLARVKREMVGLSPKVRIGGDTLAEYIRKARSAMQIAPPQRSLISAKVPGVVRTRDGAVIGDLDDVCTMGATLRLLVSRMPVPWRPPRSATVAEMVHFLLGKMSLDVLDAQAAEFFIRAYEGARYGECNLAPADFTRLEGIFTRLEAAVESLSNQ